MRCRHLGPGSDPRCPHADSSPGIASSAPTRRRCVDSGSQSQRDRVDGPIPATAANPDRHRPARLGSGAAQLADQVVAPNLDVPTTLISGPHTSTGQEQPHGLVDRVGPTAHHHCRRPLPFAHHEQRQGWTRHVQSRWRADQPHPPHAIVGVSRLSALVVGQRLIRPLHLKGDSHLRRRGQRIGYPALADVLDRNHPIRSSSRLRDQRLQPQVLQRLAVVLWTMPLMDELAGTQHGDPRESAMPAGREPDVLPAYSAPILV